MKCPNCGAENLSSAKFCVKCGYDLSQVKSGRESVSLVHKLNQDIQTKHYWFHNADNARGVMTILLIIIVIELGFAVYYLSDIDAVVGKNSNDSDNDNTSAVVHQTHKLPKVNIDD